jgi:hypothetical protein
MSPDEAEMMLTCRRPGGRDDGDAAIAEALEAVGADPAAVERWRREESLDAAIGERLRSVDPPDALLSSILLGGKLARRRRWWQRPAWLAGAAAMAISVPVALTLRPGKPVFAAVRLADFTAATTEKLNAGPSIQPLTTFDDVMAYLAGRGKGGPVPVPDNLCHAPGGTVGCEIFEWRGREVTLICFNAGKAGTVHLFTVDAAALEDRPGGPIYQPSNGWQTRSWIKDGSLMVLAGNEKTTTPGDLELLAREP